MKELLIRWNLSKILLFNAISQNRTTHPDNKTKNDIAPKKENKNEHYNYYGYAFTV